MNAKYSPLFLIGAAISYALFRRQRLDPIQRHLIQYIPLTEEAGKRYRVDPALIQAVIWVESKGKEDALKYEDLLNDYAVGLMQITPRAAKECGFRGTRSDLFNPKNNIYYGTCYLARQISRYDGGIREGIAAYNAGRAAYTSSGRFINQQYVDKVLSVYGKLR